MKKTGIMAVLLILFTAGFVYTQEIELMIDSDAVCRVFSSETDEELDVKGLTYDFDYIDDTGKLSIFFENRTRNTVVQIIELEVWGKDTGGKLISEYFSVTRAGSIKYSSGFNNSHILARSKSGNIIVQLKNIKIVTDATVIVDIWEQ